MLLGVFLVLSSHSLKQVDKQQRQGFKFTNYLCCLGALETSQQRCFSDAVSE
jgi:hypothetical protein